MPAPGANREAGAARFAPWAASPWAAVALIGGVTLLRAAYLAWWCPYTLIEDEAHYWEWSRHLDWSYYSKGPGIAWSIAASTALFGQTEAGVRAPAVLFAALGAMAAAALGARTSGDRRAGFFAAACFVLAPAFGVMGWLLTIDMPYLAAWAGACLAAWGALERRSRWAWPALGTALGAGFLFKYTIVLLVPGIALYAWVRRGRLNAAPRAGAWAALGAAVALLGAAPVAVWNAQRGWPTLRHLLGHLGLPGGDAPEAMRPHAWTWNPLWTLEFVGTQIALVGPAALLMIAGAWAAARRRGEAGNQGRVFLVLCAAPILLFYLGVTAFTDAEGNWALGGYVSLLALAGWAVVEGMDEYRARLAAWLAHPEPRPRRGVLLRRPETPRQVAWHLTVGVGLVVALVAPRLDLLERAFPADPAAGGAGAWRRLLALGRLTGADLLAADVQRLVDDLRSRTGLEPFVVAQQYGRASLLAFYLPGRPAVYCSNSFQEGRRTQQDYWERTDLTDLARLGGRPAVLVGGEAYHWTPAFEEVRPAGVLAGEPKAGRVTYLGFGYRGFAGRVAP